MPNVSLQWLLFGGALVYYVANTLNAQHPDDADVFVDVRTTNLPIAAGPSLYAQDFENLQRASTYRKGRPGTGGVRFGGYGGSFNN